MQVKAQLKYLRIAPRKVRLLADLIRGKKVTETRALLNFSLKKGSQPLRKLLEQGVANAKHNFQLEEKDLWISEIKVDDGPKLKRWRARARGRAAEIQKKTSHITLVLSGEAKEVKTTTHPPHPPTPSARAPVEKKKPEIKPLPQERRLKPRPRPKALKPEKEIGPAKRGREGLRKIFRRKAM